ncbi:hypothetical protein ABPG75_013724 [Micractinium tetrahymenae]
MTPCLQAVLANPGIRKVTFGSYDEVQLEASYPGWRVHSLVDSQALWERALRHAGRDEAWPRLCELTAWVLGWDTDKRLQATTDWERDELSEEEIAYGATDTYAHLMLWRALLRFEAARMAAGMPAAAAARSEWDDLHLSTLIRHRLFGYWGRHDTEPEVLARRVRSRAELSEEFKQLMPAEEARQSLERFETAIELPLAEPPSAERVARALLRAVDA